MGDEYYIPQVFITVLIMVRMIVEIYKVNKVNSNDATGKTSTIIGIILGTFILFGMLRWGDFYG